MLKKIGIVGGIGPESTLYYYQKIIDSFKPTYYDLGYPEIIIESLNLKEMFSFVEDDNWQALVEVIINKCNVLESAGAELGVIASNTPHKVFKEISSEISLPLISIVSATCEDIKELKLKRPLLLGTKYTMQSDFYQKELSLKRIETIVPEENDQDYIQEKLFNEIELGKIKESTKQGFLNIIDKNINNHNIDSVILGCTELPMILSEKDFGLTCIDTAKIHVNKIVTLCKAIT